VGTSAGSCAERLKRLPTVRGALRQLDHFSVTLLIERRALLADSHLPTPATQQTVLDLLYQQAAALN